MKGSDVNTTHIIGNQHHKINGPIDQYMWIQSQRLGVSSDDQSGELNEPSPHHTMTNVTPNNILW